MKDALNIDDDLPTQLSDSTENQPVFKLWSLEKLIQQFKSYKRTMISYQNIHFVGNDMHEYLTKIPKNKINSKSSAIMKVKNDINKIESEEPEDKDAAMVYKKMLIHRDRELSPNKDHRLSAVAGL